MSRVKALKKCEELGVRSVSIPMLGASDESLNEDFASAIVGTVAYASQGHELQLRSVARVRFVAYEEEQRLAFCTVLTDTVNMLGIAPQWSDPDRSAPTWHGADDTDAWRAPFSKSHTSKLLVVSWEELDSSRRSATPDLIKFHWAWSHLGI